MNFRALLLSSSLLLPPAALAQSEPADPAAPPPTASASAQAGGDAAPAKLPALEVALKAGARFPQVMNALQGTFDGIVKVGFAPFAGRQLQFYLDFSYSQPWHVVAGDDPRLAEAGASYESTLRLHDLAATLGLQYFFLPLDKLLVPYAGAGFRLHFLWSDVTGAAGAQFGQNTEAETQFGGAIFGGVGLKLGPGRALAEVALNYAPASQRVTGTSNIGGLTLLLGYGLMF